jgi:ribosomal protein S12 methylthiotransferase
VPQLVKTERYHRLMELQQGISRKRMAAMVGKVVEVLVEGLSEESDLLLQGRTAAQAPDVDGVCYFGKGTRGAFPGQMRLARIVDAGDYDFVAELLADGEALEPEAPTEEPAESWKLSDFVAFSRQ